MKLMRSSNLILSALLAIATTAFARPVILDSKKIKLEKVPQLNQEKYYAGFDVIRNAETPNRVYVTVPFQFEGQQCVEGHAEPEFAQIRNKQDWILVFKCDRSDWRTWDHTMEFVLHFRKARKLKHGETEVFKLYFRQRDFRSRNLQYAAEASDHPEKYKIEPLGSFWRDPGFRFRAIKP